MHMRRICFYLVSALILSAFCLGQQDWIRTGTGLGVEKIRLAVPDFKAAGTETQTAELLKTFNDTLWNDLDNAGIFEMVSKSFYPLQVPGNPADVKADAWANSPPNAAMLVFGNLDAAQQDVAVQGWLVDVKNPSSPPVLAKQY